jgi:acetate kinase
MGSQSQRNLILAINGGSSSIKFAFYHSSETLERGHHGSITRLGQADATLTLHDSATRQPSHYGLSVLDQRSSADFLVRWIEEHIGFDSICAVGHRVVHGMHHMEPEQITPELLRELRHIAPCGPEHLPLEIEIIDAFGKKLPGTPQVACFDTAFHSKMPRVAQLLPIPRRFDALGIQRYGFHGLSYAYLMEELTRVAGEKAARGRVILAHLGNGASLAAVRDGQSIDTSMGFTPAGGLTMGTRPGDMDPGIAWYLTSVARLSPKQFHHLIHSESGLLGVSETSSDMRDLIKSQASDVRAAEAVELCCGLGRVGHLSVCRWDWGECLRSPHAHFARPGISGRRLRRESKSREQSGDFKRCQPRLGTRDSHG